jgi:hypothetical protein
MANGYHENEISVMAALAIIWRKWRNQWRLSAGEKCGVINM